jgi:hypothetical protein
MVCSPAWFMHCEQPSPYTVPCLALLPVRRDILFRALMDMMLKWLVSGVPSCIQVLGSGKRRWHDVEVNWEKLMIISGGRLWLLS